MKKYKLGNFIPIITMFIVFILGSVFNLKGLFIIGLVGIVPLSFFIEGMLCSIKSKNFIIPLVISLSVFLVVMLPRYGSCRDPPHRHRFHRLVRK